MGDATHAKMMNRSRYGMPEEEKFRSLKNVVSEGHKSSECMIID